MGTITPLPPELLDFYRVADQEDARLRTGSGPLELERTKQLLERYVAPAPQVIRDVGGGTGVYASWLARRGHETHLLDAAPSHIELATRELGSTLASAAVGDARELPWPDESSDVVLLFGPLYHLVGKHDRMLVLSEAFRVLRPGALVLAVAIPRLVTTMNALFQGMGSASAFWEMARTDAETGLHVSPPECPNFTTAYFHDPDEFAAEFAESEFDLDDLVGVEGPGWLVPDFESLWQDPPRRAQILETAERLERRADVLGMNKHIMVAGHKPG